MTNDPRIDELLELIIDALKTIEKISKWRLSIGLLFMGDEFNKNLLKLKNF